MAGLHVAFFGSSLLSSYWNGAATYYRGLLRALHRRGHAITFYEPDALGRQRHRDLDAVPFARVVVYRGEAGLDCALASASSADVVVKASGVGVFDARLEREVAALAGPARAALFLDVDAPATLERLERDPGDPLRALVPRFDGILTYGGGPPVVAAYTRLGARRCVPIYNALDPDTHHPVPPEARFAAGLGFLGNRLPDREARIEGFFFEAARKLPKTPFLLGGSGWEPAGCPPNVRVLGHVPTRDHNAFNVSPRAVLNVARESMARVGWSPATRIFEAAGAGACLISDAWTGLEAFLEPGREILVARSGVEVAELVEGLSPRRARAVGDAARRRVLAEHTYARRAAELEAVLVGGGAA